MLLQVLASLLAAQGYTIASYTDSAFVIGFSRNLSNVIWFHLDKDSLVFTINGRRVATISLHELDETTFLATVGGLGLLHRRL